MKNGLLSGKKSTIWDFEVVIVAFVWACACAMYNNDSILFTFYLFLCLS